MDMGVFIVDLFGWKYWKIEAIKTMLLDCILLQLKVSDDGRSFFR